jgi:divinyl protochlorophyllide a 8-vinyl-reductase
MLTTAPHGMNTRADAAPHTAHRIGPNAIVQLAHTLCAHHGRAVAAGLLGESTSYTLEALPEAMVNEVEVQYFVQHCMASLGHMQGLAALHEAGARTATYLMAHRIPRMAQLAMRITPPRLALRMLLRAMQAHAWTFAGSGQFTVRQHQWGATLEFRHCAMCRGLTAHAPVCAFYAGTFQQLIRQLVQPTALVQEVRCCAMGHDCCRFEVTFAVSH